MSTAERRIDSREGSTRPRTEILDRSPPKNIDAEQGVLGSILVLPDVCDDVVMEVKADDFYDDANRTLFEHMVAMHEAGAKIDLTLLVDRLKTAGDFEAIGGMPYLAKVSGAVSNAAYAKYYAEIVREKADYRALILASTDILREAYEEGGTAKEMLNRAEQRIFSILDSRSKSSVSGIREILGEALHRIDSRMQGDGASSGVESGFTELDALCGGLHGSELIILAARPSMGKTAFVMNIAANVAIRSRVPTLFVSLEMSSAELADRLMCSEARVNGHRLRNGTISNDDRKRLVDKAGDISEAPLFVDDSPNRSVTEIAAAARRIRRREGLGLICIDYLQLIEPDDSKAPRQEQVATMARRLKGLAREMKIPVICLAQLNRQVEEGKARGNRPRLNHLRESGAIEQDADVVMFVHREEYYHSGEEREEHAGKAEIIIAKQRNGPVGEVELAWQKEYTRFENLDRRNDTLADFSSGVDF